MKHLRRLVTLVLLLACVLPGCARVPETDWVPYASMTGAFWEQGYYYFSSAGCLYFLDVEKGVNVCLCSKVGCPHDSTVHTDPTAVWDCEAYVAESNSYGFSVFFWDGGLYYILSDDYGMHMVRRNADGSGLRQIGSFCQPYIEKRKTVTVHSYICAGGYLYYSADICGLKDSIVETEACVLRRMDLKSGKEEELLQVPGHEYLSLCAAKGNGMLYLRYLLPESSNTPDDTEKRQASPVRLMLWEEGASEDTVLLEKTFREDIRYKAMRNGAILYTTKEEGSFVTRSFELNTKEDKKISDLYNLTYITGDYVLRTNPAFKKKGLYHIGKDTFLPNDFVEYTLRFLNISGNKIIFSRLIPSPKDPTLIEKEIYFFVDADALADGLQKEDAVDFYIFRYS